MEPPSDDVWRRPWGLYAVAVLVIVVVVVALVWRATGGDSDHRSRTAPTATTSPGPTQPTARTSSPPVSRAPLVTLTPDVDHHDDLVLKDVPKGWRLIGLSREDLNDPTTLVWWEPATGDTTTMHVPSLRTGGPIWLVPGDHSVLIHSLDLVPSYIYRRDGSATQVSAGPLAGGRRVLPGPEPGQVWTRDLHDAALWHLRTLDGQDTAVALRLPGSAADLQIIGDGNGYLLARTGHGVYDVRPGAREKITDGDVVAVGPTRWLTRTCHGSSESCSMSVRSHRYRSGKRSLPSPCPVRPYPLPAGVISPDGRTVALRCGGLHGDLVLYLMDLRTGEGTVVDGIRPVSPQGLVWSPSSRILFALADKGRLVAIDRRTLDVQDLSHGLPPLTRLTTSRGR